MSENPSADKFGPPPEQAKRERELAKGGKAGGVLGVTAMGIGVAALRILSHSVRGKTGGLIALLAGAGYVAMYIFRRQQLASRDDEPDPYTPPSNITR